MQTAIMETISEKVLTKYVRFLVGSFRVGEAQDGEVLTRGLTALLSGYPEHVVRSVCDPRSGLPATSKFFPTLYEVRAACDAQMRPVLAEEARRQREAQNDADMPRPISEADSARRKAFMAEMRQKMAAELAKNDPAAALHEMDARHCRGEMKSLVTKAIEKRVAERSEYFRSTPCAPLSGWKAREDVA